MIKIKRLNENIDDNKLCWVYEYGDSHTEAEEFFEIGKSQKLSKIEIDILNEQKDLITQAFIYMKSSIENNIYCYRIECDNALYLRFEVCKLPDYYYFVDIEDEKCGMSLMCDTIEGLKLIHKTFLENYDKN